MRLGRLGRGHRLLTGFEIAWRLQPLALPFLRGRGAVERVNALIARGDTLCTSAFNVEEIIRRLRGPETAAAERLIDGLRVVPTGRANGWQAGGWRRRFAARGITLSQAHCLITAPARAVAAVLATGNPRRFPMRGIEVEHWPVGE